MVITLYKPTKVKQTLNFEDLKVVRYNDKDIDSVNISIYYEDNLIGYGHFNKKTNFAHITINEDFLEEDDESDLEDYLIEGIENGTITIH